MLLGVHLDGQQQEGRRDERREPQAGGAPGLLEAFLGRRQSLLGEAAVGGVAQQGLVDVRSRGPEFMGLLLTLPPSWTFPRSAG
ncbi:hypothetical protein ACFQQB_19280 [Nonomuraea rubra]|uniref:hypothetical protein n=1 Tax=Nonomuraea rubra TaxID=46180 RepID=UPI00361E86EF